MGSGLAVSEVEEALGLEEITTHRWKVVGCSAITGEGLTEGMGWVVSEARERLFLY